MHNSLSTSIVGWSFCTAELKSDAPIRSPAPSSNVPLGSSARCCSMVVAQFVVMSVGGPSASMRPWKSLMLSRVIVWLAAWTGPAGLATTTPPASPTAVRPIVTFRRQELLIVCHSSISSLAKLVVEGHSRHT